jgi:hypothetical protein
VSADKRKGEARRLKLLRDTCDPATCHGIPPHGRIYVNVEGGKPMMLADLVRLAEDGYLVLRRTHKIGRGLTARRSYYQLTPKGWKAKATGRFDG